MQSVTGIILAGGKSSRMGTDKGLVLYKKKPMIQHIINHLKDAGIQKIMIVSANEEYSRFKTSVFKDIIPNKGPLGGIYTGLKHTTTEWNLITSCDVPNVTSACFKLLMDKGGTTNVTVLKEKNRTHHLIGLYHKSVKDQAADHLYNGNLKVSHLNHDAGVTYIEVNNDECNAGNLLANINTMETLKKLEYEL